MDDIKNVKKCLEKYDMWVTNFIKYEKLYNIIKKEIHISEFDKNICGIYCTFLTDTINSKDWCILYDYDVNRFKQCKECIETFGTENVDN